MSENSNLSLMCMPFLTDNFLSDALSNKYMSIFQTLSSLEKGFLHGFFVFESYLGTSDLYLKQISYYTHI